MKGRGAQINPANRFDPIHVERDPDLEEAPPQSIATRYFKDTTKKILAYNQSEDIGFNVGINPYRGCEHGCVYCYARPTHEYLGFSAGVDFETRIMVKADAPQLLKKEITARTYKPQVIALSGNTDCYQPVERKLRITRACLDVLAQYRHPVGIITKNKLIQRDIDLLKKLAAYHCVSVAISITSLDGDLCGHMEPRTSRPYDRLQTIEVLRQAGIPVGVMVAPIVPAINEHEIVPILKAAASAGAQWGAYTVLRLPYSLKDIFSDWLSHYFPDRKDKVLHRLQSLRRGQLYKAIPGKRMTGEGVFADQIRQIFKLAVKQSGLPNIPTHLSTAHFRKSDPNQLTLF